MKTRFCSFTILNVVIVGLLMLPDQAAAVRDEIFGSWSLVCSENCTISQATAMDPEGRKVVMGVSVYFPPGRTIANIDIRINPEAAAKAGIGLKVDDHPSFKLPMSQCDNRVCLASGFLDEPLLTQLKSGKLAKIAFLLKNSKQMIFPLSLNGFTKAYSELQLKHSSQPQKSLVE